MHKGRIYWNGKNSLDLGIVVEAVPNLNRPARKFKTYEVPGRSGVIVEPQEAYANINREYNIWFTDWFYGNIDSQRKANDVASWLYTLTGYGRLEDDFEPAYYRMAYFNGPLNLENILQKYGRGKITFSCRPERYLKAGEAWVENPTKLSNPTQFEAKPLIKIEGSGNGTFTIQGQTVSIKGMTNYLYIDCESMDCYRQSAENMNSLMTGNFPVLKPGDNNVSKTGGITKISVQPRYWTL